MRSFFVFIFFALFVMSGLVAQEDYFQQDVAYTINVELDDREHKLIGDIEIVYSNNSNQPLDFIWMHLWPNAYRNAKTALAKQQFREGNKFMFYAMDRQKGGIDAVDFKVNGSKVAWEFHPEHQDIAKVILDEALLPGESITLSTPFEVKIPSGKISRLGHIGQSYQITQWYPKPAVFDREGWHEMPYLNQGEFYSEFGSFDVSITLPKNYVLGATGDRYDSPTEDAFMDSLAQAGTNEAAIIAGSDFPPSSSQKKTVKFKQDRVHDFAWFADKRYSVLKGEVELPHSGRKVTTWAMFTPKNADLWQRSIEYLNDGTYYYSLWNGDYPYNHVTAVDGTISAGGGMEYPNITVIGNSNSALGLETVIVHEVGHNWFYGILGTNERENAWMDEGINSFNETRYIQTKYDTLTFLDGLIGDGFREMIGLDQMPYRVQDEYSYLLSARWQSDQPMQCHSDELTGINYGTIVYKKSAAAFEYLRAYLGDEKFDQAMQDYFDTWKFKHPRPIDLRHSFEKSVGEELFWFFEQIVKTDARLDYHVSGIKKGDAGYDVKVLNQGYIQGPFQLNAYKDGKLVTTKWYNENLKQGERTTVAFPSGDYDEIVLDGERRMLEYDRTDNTIRTSGLLKKVEPLKVGVLTSIEKPERTQIFINPAFGWNRHNGNMLGLNFHNTTIPLRDWEYSVTPMYAFDSKNIAGFGRFSIFKGPLTVNLRAKRFRRFDLTDSPAGFAPSFFPPASDYFRGGLEVIHKFNDAPNSPWKSTLRGELAMIRDVFGFRREAFSFSEDGDGVISTASVEYGLMNVFVPTLEYMVERDGFRTNHFLSVEGRVAISNTETQMAVYGDLTYEGTYKYNRKGRKLRWRLFAGATDNDPNFGAPWNPGPNFFGMTGFGSMGSFDDAADHSFFNRTAWSAFIPQANERTWDSRQTVDDQGGLFIPFITDAYTSAKVEVDAPVKIPVSLYVGGAVYQNPYSGGLFGNYVVGASLNIIPNTLEIHFPLVTDIQGFGRDYSFSDLISFEFNIDQLSPQKLVRSIEF